MSKQLRVAAATVLSEELCELIETIEPRVEVVRDQSLMPPSRYPGDHGGDPAFVRTAAQQAAFEAIVDSADALYGLPDESAAALRRTAEANPGLRWVHTSRAGGGAHVKEAELSPEVLQRVVFTTSAGVHADPLAEFALLGVFAGAKDLDRLQRAQRRHEWELRWTLGWVSRQRIAVVGLGSIGRAVTAKLAAVGATVIGVHRRIVEVPGASEVVTLDRLAEVLGTVDAVVLALPGTDLTQHMFDRAAFAAMKPGVTLVNVGRGSTVDESALVDALVDGTIGFAALDVFEVEPLPQTSPLWAMDNVIISPHGAAITVEEDRLIAELFAENATRLLDGLPLRNVVNTVEFY
ncbi:D-2-hydroxyacid dehydrogenase [Microbacterium invictum]|uniref:Phosphoglycerate dehydrogenase-like enzyme n=1 Tax=Microbacterium invictum TaxID=515415 RepID=A0AA40SPY7_9MICO|nr:MULTISPECIES: D-2-hydroxyacid dehydrogenase [Microbacterium]MBB4140263.1 phosphoglycerate dehydrogenase-like enzyme [Microbacterium invictum]